MTWRSVAVVQGLGLALALAVRAHADPPLQALALSLVGPGQGVFVDADDGTVLVAEAADRPVHPASVTKVATSLALLEKLGPEHRFETRVTGKGTLQNGRLAGDLIVHGGNDPFFVFESAFLVLQRLRVLGLHEVGGALRVEGPFIFNWQPDPTAGRLARALRGKDGAEAWHAVAPDERFAQAALRLDGGRATADGDALVVTHRSPDLVRVLKSCNGYSNNVLHYASDSIGGPHAVEAIARAGVPEALRGEIVIDNGAGGGTTNRMSPRAAVAILRKLETHTREIGHQITDVLPVSGVDPGTLKDRLLDHRRYVVGKTGTFGSVGASALVGLLRSPRYGTVAFGVLNAGVPVPQARAKQDAFVRALIDAVGAEPWPYQTPMRPPYLLAKVE
jgi:D-alanyl-D-alanine carboxypeptidase/D-alanyl-D-alanine-endopeptidase (penicillin-binding protein 4)